jgi:tetratricopeptide (TPR) repeat protein
LEVGEPAPSLDPVTWIAGQAPTATGQVRVVQLLGTWCPISRKAVPKLAALQAAYPGRVALLALCDEEAEPVKTFAADSTVGLTYPLGIVAAENWAAWSDGSSGVPHAYIIDQDGTVLWSGTPANVERPLAQVLSKALDINRAKTLGKLELDLETATKAYNDHTDDDTVRKHLRQVARQVLDLDPSHVSAFHCLTFIAKKEGEPATYRELFARMAVESFTSEQLNNYAWALATDQDLSYLLPEEALRLVNVALKSTPDDASVLDTRARARYLLGDLDGAIADQARTVEIDAKSTGYQASLAYLRRIKALKSAPVTPSAP